tara:strand:- start:461 stop:1414 length:954 start_codon:yes stop_codon:yes gene_type:complete
MVFLDRSGFDGDRMQDLTSLPQEYLRDPTGWVEATAVEELFELVERELGSALTDALATEVGHSCPDLRAWGVLDSVIRMMPRSQDLFLQPERFISYFVSPAPPLADIVRKHNEVEFSIPISNQEYPHTSEFLRSALEALPKYLGKDEATVVWVQNKVSIKWEEGQKSFFQDTEQPLNYKPELVQGLMEALEQSQKQIETLNAQLSEGNPTPQPLGEDRKKELKAFVVKTRGHLMRLSDYLVRSQQLVTLLVGQDRLNKQVREAMKRVDWDYVKSQSNQVAQDIADLLSDFEKEVEKDIPTNSYSVKKKESLQARMEV